MHYIILSVFIIALSACQATPEQLAEMDMRKQAWLAEQCTGYGFKEGTKEFRNCKIQTEEAAYQRYFEQLRIQQQRSAALGAIGSQLINQSAPRPMNAPNTMTTCSRMGHFVNCW